MGLADMFRCGGFDIPVGPAADLAEIEYLSALHQTGENPIRSDGTISSEDIRIYLRSRYGLDIPLEECRDIVRGLGGTAKTTGDNDGGKVHVAFPTPEPDASVIMALAQSSPRSVTSDHANTIDDNEYLDLIQFVSILLIPSLQRAKRQIDIDNGIIKIEPIPDLPDTNWRLAFQHPKMYRRNKRLASRLTQQKKEREHGNSLDPSDEDGNIISMVLRVLLDAIDVSAVDTRSYANNNLPRVMVNKHTVERLLDAFGFGDLKSDDILVSQMVQAAGGPGTTLDETTFARALTCDVDVRPVAIEDDACETIEDVYGYGVTSLEYVVGRRINRRRQDKAEQSAECRQGHKTLAGFDEEEGVTPFTPTSSVSTPPSPSVSAANVSPNAQEESVASADGADDGEWVSFDAGDNSTVDWSKAKGEINVSTSGGIEVSTPPPRQDTRASLLNVDEQSTVQAGAGDEGDGVLVETKKPTHIPTAPFIDYVLDEYKSIAYLCGTWVFYLLGAAGSMALIGLVDIQVVQCSGGFLCNLVQQVWSWLAFGLMLSLGGFLVVTPLSLGNDPHRKDLCGVIISVVWAVSFGTLPYSLLKSYAEGIPHSPDGVLTEIETLLSQPYFKLMAVLFFVFGLLLALKMLLEIPMLCIPESVAKKSPVLSYLFIPSSKRSAAATKQAATRKINRMIGQARTMHFKTQLGAPVSALDQYFLCGQTSQSSGGLFWTWKEIFSGRLVNTHGVWLHSNLLIGQEGQVIVLSFGLALGIWGGIQLGESLAKQREALEQEPPSYLRDQSLYFTPYPWNVYVSFGVGLAIAGIIGASLLALYIPSTVATVMKLRTGVISTFRSPTKFGVYRTAADTICYNAGNMVYAVIGSTSLFFLLGAGAVFLLVWKPTQDFFINLIGWGLGLGITIGLKFILTKCTRANFQEALYRKKPRSANFTGLWYVLVLHYLFDIASFYYLQSNFSLASQSPFSQV
mmetsp:Transcript_5806/g.12622  ORF Transcript_5806/g.12622 Transcript_5806/m.12622 type:complete len:968 (-) Transcript_5806:4825-7728(-)